MDALLLRLAEEQGIRVVEAPGAFRGGFDPERRTIRLSPGMSRRTTRSVFAHELGHAALGHGPTSHPLIDRRQERQADAWAARLLISPQDYAAAEARRGAHLASLAFDLDVTVELVAAYRRLLHLDD